VKEWKTGECELIPGKTAPQHCGGRTRLPQHLASASPRWGPLMEKVGNGGKGIGWDTKTEVEQLKPNSMARCMPKA
jgi:nitrate reductase alpha subunit